MPEPDDPYQRWPLPDRLEMLAFEAELAHLPRSLISAIWEAGDLSKPRHALQPRLYCEDRLAEAYTARVISGVLGTPSSRCKWPSIQKGAILQILMPMLAFFPWATLNERLSFGAFHLVPCAQALVESAAAPNRDAVTAILESYGHRRPVDRENVPFLVSVADQPFADLSSDQVGASFDFRLRLTFSVLAARKFFSLHYCNSDSLRLVIQGFTPDRSGSALIVSRRRDGQTNNIVSGDSVRVARPHHAPWCELPRDVDAECLRSLEAAIVQEDERAGRLSDAIQIFVGANSDSPDMGLRTELVDSVGAFSRLFGEWDERETVSSFVKTLPANPEPDLSWHGARAARNPLRQWLAAGKSIRGAWLADAYRLRSQYAHGHVDEPLYKSAWAVEEHLLLAAYVFPLTVKATLAAWGYYQWTEDDQMHSDAFDSLATLDAFSSTTSGDQSHPWTKMLSRFQLRPLAKAFARSLQAAVERSSEVQETATKDNPDLGTEP